MCSCPSASVKLHITNPSEVIDALPEYCRRPWATLRPSTHLAMAPVCVPLVAASRRSCQVTWSISFMLFRPLLRFTENRGVGAVRPPHLSLRVLQLLHSRLLYPCCFIHVRDGLIDVV